MNTLFSLFILASNQFNLPPDLLASVCFVETKYDVNAIHHDDGGTDSLGICQIKYKTAQWLGFEGTEEQLMNPKVNIYYAAKYLAYQHKRFGYRVNKTAIAYNRGNAFNLTATAYSNKVIERMNQIQSRNNGSQKEYSNGF